MRSDTLGPMDLRTLPLNLNAAGRVDERRARIERELGIDLSILQPRPASIGQADEKNCENMFGAVPIPIGYAGPLSLHFSDKTETIIHLPLATTEGALVASVNRGCKAVNESKSVRTSSIRHGITRSMAFKVDGDARSFTDEIKKKERQWKAIAEATSNHLTILDYQLHTEAKHVFLTIVCDTDEAMGMNMVTIAAQAIGAWMEENFSDCTFLTVAANVDSDKKPSLRTYENGRGFEATATVTLSDHTITSILKSSADAMEAVAIAKLDLGSDIAGAIGRNLHAANIIAALYIATGQDAAHVVEGSLSDTYVERREEGLKVTVRLPALLLGVRGGGTSLPAQHACLNLLLQPKTSLHPCAQLAESIAAAVLAGEISLLAAQASHHLSQAHQTLGR